ncbi:RNA polymerase sigma factor [Peristeroidobacter soli]|jgi:RNA polymerase sigma-70 factor (ECF subfamily)|uniref:RNA polymerase sigma factor n=1 Tax=Peristeroidobacter soli TaxID=2497877 RepID=UPI00101D2671|nr:sigma-70 family RNA polymerase sigma factor [Peristeroidobacter soli]
MDEELDNWFAREVLSHEPALVRYLARIWPRHHEVHDLRQEIYIRVYEAALRSRPQNPKSFLFTTARHLMVDRVRRERVVSIEATADLDALNVLVDEISPEHHTSARQDLRRLADAFDMLPVKCRDVVWMRKVEELSQREVAARIGITEGAVEKRITKGIRLLAELYYGGDADDIGGATAAARTETEHGKQNAD